MQLTSIRRADLRAGIILIGLTGILSACGPAYLDQRTDEPQGAADAVRSADLTPRFPTPVRNTGGSGGARNGVFLSFGAVANDPSGDAAATAQAPEPSVESPDGYTLNFSN